MLPYYVVLVVSVAAAALSEFQRRYDLVQGRARGGSIARFFALVAGTVLVSVAALRWRVGTDYVSYSVNYEEYKTQPLGWLDEPGIRIIARLSGLLRDDYTTMFAIASIITVGLTVATLYSRSRTFAFAVLIYILSASWQGSFNGIRQYLACAVLFAGHKLILDRRFTPYVVIVLIAALFHVSALVAILFYWVPRKRMSRRNTILLLAIAAIAIAAYDQLGAVFEWVKQEDVTAGSYFERDVSFLRVLFAVAPVFVYWIFTNRREWATEGYFYVNMLIVNAAVFIASSGSAYVARFAIYTQIYLALAIPLLVQVKNPKERWLLSVLFVAIFGVFWYIETSGSINLSNFRWVTERF